MNKSLLITLAAAACIPCALASPLSPEEALQRLGTQTRSASSAMRLVHTTLQKDGEPALYIFDNTAAPGYLLLSADDCAAPLLGYSDSGSFKEDEMAPALKWWIEQYARQIEYARENNLGEYSAVQTRAGKKAVAPMIKTKWNQSSPYNGMTPTLNGKHLVTGCVATSTAQVMNYWKYPEVGKGKGTATVTESKDKVTDVEMDFSTTKFDWANMLDSYSGVNATPVQKNAVAYLMKACGYGVHMNYTPSQSGAASVNIANALVNNFGYNPNTRYCDRNYYDPYDWEDMVYGELAAGRPLVYGGQSTEGGHSFVCDGYDGNGMYHFNWGWGGMSDGYFSLNALNPSSLGIGANGGGYNFYQDITIGIQPQKGPYLGHDIILEGSLSGTISGSNVVVTAEGLYNNGGVDMTVSIGTKIEPLSGSSNVTPTIMEGKKDVALQVGYGWGFTQIKLPLNSLANGSYKVSLWYKERNESTWMPVLAEQLEYNYIIVTKSGNTYSVVNNNARNIKITGGDVVGDLIYGQAATVTVSVNNPTDVDVTKSVYPVLCNGLVPVMVAQGVTLNLDQGETVTEEFQCLFTLIDGATAPTTDTTYKLRFYDPSVLSYYDNPINLAMYQGFSKDVTMIKGEDPKLVVTNFTMPGVPMEGNAYIVSNVDEMPFSCTVRNSGGPFSNYIAITLWRRNDADRLYYYEAESTYPSMSVLAKGETKTFTSTFNFSSVTDGYYLAAPEVNQESIADTSGYASQILLKIVTAGVNEIVAEEDLNVTFDRPSSMLKISSATSLASVAVYSVDGSNCYLDAKASGDESSVDLSHLPSGIYLVKVKAASGATRALKIAK